MDRESAEQWNAAHPQGTVVSISLRSGKTISAPTASPAQQWGDLALVTLSGVPGVWTVGALRIKKRQIVGE
jgi:hypothetical protein